MRGRGLAAMAMVVALGAAPAAAHADPASSTVTSWTSSETGTPQNSTYLISYDNPGHATTLTVRGTANFGPVDIVCYFGTGPGFGHKVLAANVPVAAGSFGASALLRSIAGHACRLRAIPIGGETSSDQPQFAGPQVAVSQVGLPAATVGPEKLPYDFYVIGTTLTGYAGWGSAGSCGPYAAPFDRMLGQGNFAIDCMGSLLGAANLPGLPNRSEVQVDGQNAYDPASAQAVFGGTEDLGDFPSLTALVTADPTDGLITSQSTEGWVTCPGLLTYPPTSSVCPKLAAAGVGLERTVTTSDGGQVVTMTDTWSSTDGRAHSLDLLYDDYAGLKTSTAQRGYEFPGQSTFSGYGPGATMPGPGSAPGSILVRTNLAAHDGDTSEAVGAITFSTPPSGFTFASNNEFEEHQLVQVPGGGHASLTYVYSTAYTVAQAQALALAAQDRLEAPTITITSPATGTIVSSPTESVTGTASAGSGISSVNVAGEAVPVDADGGWSAQVPLSPGSNTITALATDAAGATVQADVTVVYEPPPPPPPPPPVPSPPPAPGPTPGPVCKVPRIKGMKLPAAEHALRQAHCRVGRIKHEHSNKVRTGRVVATSPRAGWRMAAGSRVELFLSNGP